jgi:tellurite resistance protein TerC
LALPTLRWVLFIAGILFVLSLDLFVLHRGDRRITVREAVIGCVFWVALALAFNVYVYFWRGKAGAMEFLTGYLIEESLSVDNIFVFVLLMNFFAVPSRLQHRVLFWGILGAIAMRLILILAGAALIARFEWVLYLFGLFLVGTGIKFLFHKDSEVHPENNPMLRLFRRVLPMTSDYRGGSFFVREDGKLKATPLLLVLVMIETTDLIFAFDSIPAIFGITHHTFIIFSSNIFAVLGLRSLYFLLSGVIGLFRYLQLGLAVIMIFIGVKMLVAEAFHIPVGLSLAVVFVILATAIVASIRASAREAAQKSNPSLPAS